MEHATKTDQNEQNERFNRRLKLQNAAAHLEILNSRYGNKKHTATQQSADELRQRSSRNS